MKSLLLLTVLTLALQADEIALCERSKTPKRIKEEPAVQPVPGAPHYQSDGFFASADFLYWQASEDNLEYADKAFETPGTTIYGSGLSIKPQALHFNWRPGFRVGLGYEMGSHDHWDLYLNYTYFYGTAHRTSTLGSSIGFITTWDPILLNLDNGGSKGSWDLHYNVGDVELGKDYYLGTHLTLRPFFGLRGAGIIQTYHSKYFESVIPNTPVAKFKAEGSFWGAGIRAGSNLFWHFTKHWGICGDVSGSLLYGQCKVHERFNANFPNLSKAATTPITNRIDESVSRVRTNLQASIGLEWESLFDNGKKRAAISISYEINEWFNLNPYYFSDTTLISNGGNDAIVFTQANKTSGDLGLQGGTLKLMFDF